MKTLLINQKDVILGKREWRVSASDITVFDDAGLSIEDIALTWEVYNLVLQSKLGAYADFKSSKPPKIKIGVF